MRIISRLAAAVVFVCAAAQAQAQIVVQGPWIMLSDVADARGAAAGTPVAPAPAPGQSLALDPAYVARIAADAGVFVDFGAAPIWVSRAVSAPPRAPRVKPASLAISAPSAAIARTAPAIDPFDDMAPEPGLILVFARDMKRGDVVAVSDLEWIAPSGSGATPRGAPDRMSDVVGQELKRGVREGRSFRIADLRPAAAIKKGEPVTLTYNSYGLRLSVEGKALADAVPGAPLRVMNLYSNRTVEAVAVAPGEARVLQR